MAEGGRQGWSRRALLRRGGIAASVVLSGGMAAAELNDETERSRIGSASGRRVPDGEPPGMRRVVWSVDTDEPAVSLTFDDGPDPELTPLVLDALDRAGVPATFLVVGRRAEAHPALIRDMVAAGHEVGSHTLTHPDLSRTSGSRTVRELAETASIVEASTGSPARWFRPPWGRLTGAAVRTAAELGHDLVLWSVSPNGLGPSPQAVADGLAGRLAPGQVVLLHDGVCRGRSWPLSRRTVELQDRRRTEIEALPQLIDQAQTGGLRFVTASQLIDLAQTGAETPTES